MINAIISNVDVLPTIFEFIGIDIPGNIQGRSFIQFLNGNTSKQPRSEAFSQYTPDMKRDNLSRSVINEQYHLIRYFDQGRAVEYPVAVNPQAFATTSKDAKQSGEQGRSLNCLISKKIRMK